MSDTPAFPPQEIGAFLRFCAGEWMGLRSQFALGEVVEEEGANGDEWHSSERGELLVTFLEPTDDGPGGLRVGPRNAPPRELLFSADGLFSSSASGEGSSAAGPSGGLQGHWQLWPDGSLELWLSRGDREVRERIWFTKPNLRLRSTVERQSDGTPGQASFSTEIRRVSQPASGG